MSSTLKADLEDILSCSICLERLTEPKLLPCSHRFCKTCLCQKIDRSATSGPARNFPCPLCKRTVHLSRGKRGNEQAGCFETDRLLKDVLERLDSVTEDPSDVCSPHMIRLEIVCYSCRETGCVRCAWEKHRHCKRVETYENEAERVERDLRYHFQDLKTSVQKITSHVRIWAQVKKSSENQIQYSNRFVHQCVQHKIDQFKSMCSHLIESYESYIRNRKVSLDLKADMKRLMEISSKKLDIDAKCEEATLRLKERNSQCFESVRKASAQIDSVPDTSQLDNILDNITKVLNLNKRDMVVQGEQLLNENEEILSESFRNQIQGVTPATPVSFHLDGLVTSEDQVHLGIEDEEKLLEQLGKATEAADDPRCLISDIEKLCFPQRSHQKATESLEQKDSDNDWLEESTKCIMMNPFASSPV